MLKSDPASARERAQLTAALRDLIELASVHSALQAHADAVGDKRVGQRIRSVVRAIEALNVHVNRMRSDAWISGAAADHIDRFGVAAAEVFASWGIELTPGQKRALEKPTRSAVASKGIAAIARVLGVHERSVYKARKRGAVEWTALRAVPMGVRERDQLYFVLGLFGFDQERSTAALRALGIDTEDPRDQ